MSTAADLRRVERLICRLTGDKADRDEALYLVRRLLSEHEHAAAFEAWTVAHAPQWNGKPAEVQAIQLGLAQGHVDRDDLAAILSAEDGTPASYEAVRQFVTRLRLSLHRSGATASVKQATRSGVYRTHDPSIQTLGEV
jgi:hypothetical protein